MRSCFPIYSHIGPQASCWQASHISLTCARSPCSLCLNAGRHSPPTLPSTGGQELMSKSNIHIMEKVSGERAECLRNLTNIRLVAVGLSSHPRHQFREALIKESKPSLPGLRQCFLALRCSFLFSHLCPLADTTWLPFCCTFPFKKWGPLCYSIFQAEQSQLSQAHSVWEVL